MEGFSCPNEGVRPSLGLAMARNPEIDCCKGQLTALRVPYGPQWAIIPAVDNTSLLECSEVTKNG